MKPISNNNAGLNTTLFMGGLSGLAAYHLWPDPIGSPWQQYVLAGLLAATAGAVALKGSALLAHDIRVRKNILNSEAESSSYGSAREASEEELDTRGCFDPSGGMFIGFKFGRAVFAPADCPFKLVEGPPGSSKGICLSIADIMHHSLMGCSVFSPDIKPEMAPMLIPGLKRAGVETWAINPTSKFVEQCGNAELNLYQALIDAIYSDANGRKDAVGIAKNNALLHLPDDKSDGGKKYFVGGSRRCLTIPPLLNALIDPANCTPANSFNLLNDPERFKTTLKTIIDKLEPLGEDDRIELFLKSEAKNLLDRAEKNAENLGSFLEWATQALTPYNQAGHLADIGRNPTHNIKAMCEQPITAFAMTPHSHVSEFESFTSILNANLLAACKRNPRKQKVHLVCDEFLNYRFSNIASELEVMRGLGLTASFYIQSFAGLVRKYGKETAASVNDYCDVKIYLGLNSYERAKHVSDMLSEATIESKDYSYQSRKDDVNINSKHHARRLMTPDEVLAMPRDQAWVFIKGMRPFRVHLKHYGHVDPWKELVGDNPMEGPPLQGETLLKIDYPERGLK